MIQWFVEKDLYEYIIYWMRWYKSMRPQKVEDDGLVICHTTLRQSNMFLWYKLELFVWTNKNKKIKKKKTKNKKSSMPPAGGIYALAYTFHQEAWAALIARLGAPQRISIAPHANQVCVGSSHYAARFGAGIIRKCTSMLVHTSHYIRWWGLSGRLCE
jgi:hypothetical protein